MDWRIISLGLLLDTVPCWWLITLGQAGFSWWNNGTFFVVPVIISCAVIVTAVGLAKHGRPSPSFSESDLIVVSAGIGVLVIFFGILPVNLTAISYSWHCLESGLPWFCDKASAINSLAWIWLTLLLAPAVGFFGAVLFVLRRWTRLRLGPKISRPGQAIESC
jgi:hypothetical protein